MTDRYKALLLLNPNSGRAKQLDMDAVRAVFERNEYTLDICECSGPEDMRRAFETEHVNVDLIVLGGGDGTFSGMADLLKNTEVTLGVLPLGTANDLARSLDIPLDPMEAIEVLFSDQTRLIDLGCVNGHYFFNVAHIGLGADMSDHIEADVKKGWGALCYARTLIAQLKKTIPFKARIVSEGKTLTVRSIQLSIGSGRFYGGGNIIDQDSDISDGLLTLFCIKQRPTWKLFLLAPLARFGLLKLDTQTLCQKSKKIDIHTNRRKRIYADGEQVGHTPARFEIYPGCIRVKIPVTLQQKLQAFGDVLSDKLAG